MEILPGKKGEACLEISFTYDINGILEVEVTDHQLKRMKRKVLTSEKVRMSEEELYRRLEELQAYKPMPYGGVRTKMIMAKGERLFTQLLGARRQQVAIAMHQIEQAIMSRDEKQINRVLKEAKELFDRLEES